MGTTVQHSNSWAYSKICETHIPWEQDQKFEFEGINYKEGNIWGLIIFQILYN